MNFTESEDSVKCTYVFTVYLAPSSRKQDIFKMSSFKLLHFIQQLVLVFESSNDWSYRCYNIPTALELCGFSVTLSAFYERVIESLTKQWFVQEQNKWLSLWVSHWVRLKYLHFVNLSQYNLCFMLTKQIQLHTKTISASQGKDWIIKNVYDPFKL